MIWFLDRTQCIDDDAKFEGKHQPQRGRKYADPQNTCLLACCWLRFCQHRDSVKWETNNGQ